MFLRQTAKNNEARLATDYITYVMWPIAIMTVIHRAFIKAANGNITDDFRPVYDAAVQFLRGLPVYTANYDWVDPHYLYPPSGTLIIAPLGYFNPDISRWLFIIANVVAIIVAGYFLLRMFSLSVTSAAAPILLFAMFSSETVSNTLVFTNINGLVLLGEVLFMTLLLNGHQYRSGAAIGLTLAVKPILAPLLLLPLMNRQWRPFVTALAIPLTLTGLAWPLSNDPMAFFERTSPYLIKSRDYFNSSIVGNGLYYGISPILIWSLRIGLGITVLISLWLLYRYYRKSDQLFWMATSSGVILTAQFLLGSLGQGYYSMMLFPLLMTIVLQNSVLRNWPAWLAIYGFLTYDQWLLIKWQTAGRAFEYLKITAGWSLLLIVICTVLSLRYLTARAEGRPQQGLDTNTPVA
ncbi:MAG: glycosyltransferase family 87 protein [Mycobacteriaceae bacterium]